MEHYNEEIREVYNRLVNDGEEAPRDILKRWTEGDTGNDFGNIDGSRFCNAYKAKEALQAAGFPWNDDINERIEAAGYNVMELLEKGPEVVDVVICELLAAEWAYNEMESLKD